MVARCLLSSTQTLQEEPEVIYSLLSGPNFIVLVEWPPPESKSIIFSGLVNNIFNKKYVSNGYYFTYDDTWSVPGEIMTIEGAGYYPQATTNFLLGVTLKF